MVFEKIQGALADTLASSTELDETMRPGFDPVECQGKFLPRKIPSPLGGDNHSIEEFDPGSD